ncbi:MAG: hypothetical protein WA397_25030 [Roseiarcus sp.]
MLRARGDITLLFYAALNQDRDLSIDAERSAHTLGNMSELEQAEGPLARIVSYEGSSITRPPGYFDI